MTSSPPDPLEEALRQMTVAQAKALVEATISRAAAIHALDREQVIEDERARCVAILQAKIAELDVILPDGYGGHFTKNFARNVLAAAIHAIQTQDL